jgi:hypothetical protein
MTAFDFEVTGSKVTGALIEKGLSAQLLKIPVTHSLHIWHGG